LTTSGGGLPKAALRQRGNQRECGLYEEKGDHFGEAAVGGGGQGRLQERNATRE